MRSIRELLRPKGGDAAALYSALVGEARRPGWYLEGGAEDTLDGRFAVLSSLVAIAILRLESGGEAAVRASVSLTEGFIADMDAQMREAGFGDPSIGKQVRQMVGALAARVDRWRATLTGEGEWSETVRFSVHRGAEVAENHATYAGEALRRFSEGLAGLPDDAVMAGNVG